MTTRCTSRFSVHPRDFKSYDTQRIREEFLVENILMKDEINFVYSHYDRFMVGGAVPVSEVLTLEPVSQLKSSYFLERREMGIINVGGSGTLIVDGETYPMAYKEALYLGQGSKMVQFESDSKDQPAHFYLNSAPAHKTYPNKMVRLSDARILQLGSLTTSSYW